MEILNTMLLIVIIVLLMLLCYLRLRQQEGSRDSAKAVQNIDGRLIQLQQSMSDDLDRERKNQTEEMRALREELANQLTRFGNLLIGRISEGSSSQLQQLDHFAKQLERLMTLNEEKFNQLRDGVEKRLLALQQDNNHKLEEMRQTVDEKLNDTLEKRLGESFRMVSRSLEQVHKGLGEMQSLAAGVGDLKKVLTNVKTRGIWGEIQLGNLLEQVLAPQQYAENIATVPHSSERVEFAIRLPGNGGDDSVWLPIDSKFPQEDYQRLLAAQENGDSDKAEECAKALEIRIKAEAKDIHDKYIAPPATTEFGVLFLPIEGLYAEVLRRPGLCELLMEKYHIAVTGPTTLAAFLNSLQMGFRTLAIEQRSVEVWKILGAVKSEFSKFGDLLDKTHKKLQEASNSIDTAARKSRTIERKLKDVEALPADNSVRMLDK